MKRSTMALAVAAAGAVGLGALAVPAGAGGQPELPEVSAEDLVSSVLTAEEPALAGTVRVDNGLGLPALPGLGGDDGPGADGGSPLTAPTSTARVWADGEGRSRLALPSRAGERTVVDDGTTVWAYDSSTRTATAVERGDGDEDGADATADPAGAARAVLGAIRTSSTVSVDGTAEVAGREAYELVLTPAATERTLLREVRVAVDSETRLPLRLTVLATGSPAAALEIGFSELDLGAQDPALFAFTAPDGVTVERPELPEGPTPEQQEAIGQAVQVRGEGWDTVVVSRVPLGSDEDTAGTDEDAAGDPRALLEQVGEPASGDWGTGYVVRTTVATVLVADDGRVAAGAVPQEVLDEALSR